MHNTGTETLFCPILLYISFKLLKLLNEILHSLQAVNQPSIFRLFSAHKKSGFYSRL